MQEITGTIDHRILLNFRIDPEVMRAHLPEGFEPVVVEGYAIGGICQVSLSNMRPKGLPAFLGARSHNAAHRIAVSTSKGEGVYVPRRDTNSALNAFSGGRLFPGAYSKAEFSVSISGEHYRVSITSPDGGTVMDIDASVVDALPEGSVFANTGEVSDFFQRGRLGWSPAKNGGYDGIELTTREWRMEPMRVTRARSAYFVDETAFPPGSVSFDSAMIMRHLEHSWIQRDALCAPCA